jgi:DNA-binding response OmpR family regulator
MEDCQKDNAHVLVVGHDERYYRDHGSHVTPVSQIAIWLEQSGFRTTLSYDPDEAYKIAFNQRPDVIIVADVMLPDQYADGFVKRINSIKPLPGIILVNTGDSNMIIPGRQAASEVDFYKLVELGYGGDAYLTHPLSPEHLLPFVQRMTREAV